MRRISNRVHQFIYDHVDSVAFLEILLLFHAHPGRKWGIGEMAVELRSNFNSTQSLIELMIKRAFVRESSPGIFELAVDNAELVESVAELAACYQVLRHKVLELIFSPLKRSRDFLDAFKRVEKKEDGGG